MACATTTAWRCWSAFAKPYDHWDKLYTFPYGVVPYDLDMSPDGRLLSASVAEVSGDQFLRVWEVERIFKGDAKPLSEFKFGQSVPESFVFTPDGRYLYGSSYYTGASNIFRYEVTTGDVEAVSNAETGFFRPVPLADGRLMVLTYTGAGFVPATIEPRPLKDVSAITFLGTEVAEKYPGRQDLAVPPPSTVDEQKLITEQGPYLPWRNMALTNAYPVLQGYKNYAGIGYRFNFEDPLQLVESRRHRGVHTGHQPSGQRARPRGHLRPLRVLEGRAGLESLGLLRPVRSYETEPQGLCRQARLRLAAGLRRAAPARRPLRRRLVRPDRHAADGAEYRD